MLIGDIFKFIKELKYEIGYAVFSPSFIRLLFKTKSGFVFKYEKYFYRIVLSKYADDILLRNLDSYMLIASQKNINNFVVLVKSKNILVTKELYLSKKKVNLPLIDYINFYYQLSNGSLKYDFLNYDEFIKNNFLNSHKNILKYVCNNLSLKRKYLIGAIHGDFWHENVIITDNKIYAIDYDRSSLYSFADIDIINLYVMHYLSYKAPSHSWDSFVKLLKDILMYKEEYNEVSLLINNFYIMFNVNDYVLSKDVLMLYVCKTIYNNDFFLSGLDSLRWRRSRFKILELLK